MPAREPAGHSSRLLEWPDREPDADAVGTPWRGRAHGPGVHQWTSRAWPNGQLSTRAHVLEVASPAAPRAPRALHALRRARAQGSCQMSRLVTRVPRAGRGPHRRRKRNRKRNRNVLQHCNISLPLLQLHRCARWPQSIADKQEQKTTTNKQSNNGDYFCAQGGYF